MYDVLKEMIFSTDSISVQAIGFCQEVEVLHKNWVESCKSIVFGLPSPECAF